MEASQSMGYAEKPLQLVAYSCIGLHVNFFFFLLLQDLEESDLLCILFKYCKNKQFAI